MLHEVLLGLAGHFSPLLEADFTSNASDTTLQPHLRLSASEKQLLSGIGSLSRTHRQLNECIESIVQSHPSVICRAVANSIQQTHLRRFRARILEVESNILRNDASTVGAYDIVPLAFVVGQFDEWHRRIAWYWDVVTYMLGPDKKSGCSGAALVDRLRSDLQTGYPDIESVARELSTVAEMSWLKQLSLWLLYGRVNTLGKDDFFVRVETDEQSTKVIRKRKDLLPRFVSISTADSILFIGRSLNVIEDHRDHQAVEPQQDDIRSSHLKLLADLSFPIQPAQFSRVILQIRSSLSQNLLKDLLPAQTITTALVCLRRYLLLANSDFASCLLAEAEKQMNVRWKAMNKSTHQDTARALQGLSMKDTEVTQVLRQTWKVLTLSSPGQQEDDVLEFAKKHSTLIPVSKPPSRPTTADSAMEGRVNVSAVTFDDLLLSAPTKLSLQIKSPFNLLFSTSDLQIYSSINAYLLGIRRGQQRLEDLWRQKAARRSAEIGSGTQQTLALRQAWAMSSAALLLLSELAAYLSSTVISSSCDHFERWALQEAEHDLPDDGCSNAISQRDPESIAAGHRIFLDVLTHAILLTDVAYTQSLRALLTSIDVMTSLFGRLLETPSLDEDLAPSHLYQDQKLYTDLRNACQGVDRHRRSVLERLKDVHNHQYDPIEAIVQNGRDTGGYKPLRVGALDQLLMKLE